mmetsp:Transcript_9572/g.13766  ORF Transcript_9572/g.13766 Transcript_9572/m.13766 type:complete len:808 (+) Transcript_9572:100-2523(+)
MPQKPPFDPTKHRIDGNTQGGAIGAPAEASNCLDGNTGGLDDDEALARMLQEQILEEERQMEQAQQMTAQQQHVSSSSQMDNDMRLLLEMQRQEMEALQNDNDNLDDMELARRMQQEEAMTQMQSGYQNQLDFARRLRRTQEQSFDDTRHQNPTTYPNAKNYANHVTNQNAPQDTDFELARRIQEFEHSGITAFQRTASTGSSATQLTQRANNPPHQHFLPQDSQRSTASTKTKQEQEEADARLAIMLAESGGSFRNLDVGSLNPSTTNVPTPIPPPAPAPPPTPAPVPPPPPQQRARTAPVPLPPPQRRARTAPVPPPIPQPTMPSRRVPEPPQQNTEPEGLAPKKRRGFFSRGSRDRDQQPNPTSFNPQPKKPSIPAPIPPPPRRTHGPLPYSAIGSRQVEVPVANGATMHKKKIIALPTKKPQSICVCCKKPTNSFLVALDQKYHADCFKCVGCHMVIDASGPFAYMTDESGNKHPLHRKCYAELYGVKCAVCKQSIPAGPDGKVSFVKHPFFDSEQMCPRHAQNPGRRCTGCHRFEPEGEPFAELNDSGRCVCFSCCRSVVVDSEDAQPLWDRVVKFLEEKLHLPIWKDLRKVPILVVGYDALNEQMKVSGAVHKGSSQIMTRGLCLTEHQSGRKFKLAAMKFNKHNFSFEACDVESRGYTFFQVPDANKVNPDASVTAILCLAGLPKDLSASVLAHEATHAWIKLHPQFDIDCPIPPQVEEGCAQLVAMLFLTEGMDAASTETYGDPGPSDEKLRQYFKFSIETDDHDIYGEGYRRAATAYANIGIEALLSHVVLYKDFPKT